MNERVVQPELPKSLEEQIQDASDVAEAECKVASVLPAYRLMVFNERFGTDTATHPPEIQRRRLQRLEEIELEYQKKFPLLPTIGVELEVPEANASTNQMVILQNFKIRCGFEDDDVVEVAPMYSYSALGQSRILEECAKLGLGKQNGFSDTDLETSLHVNLGIPKGLSHRSDTFYSETNILTDSLTYGFVSPARILSRKTDISNDTKSAWSNDSQYRLELRTPDFSSPTTFRMLEETQLLAAACFAYVKQQDGLEISADEQRFSEVWSCFRLEAESLLETHELKPVKSIIPLYDSQPKILAPILSSNPHIARSFRALFDRTSKEIKKIVNLNI